MEASVVKYPIGEQDFKSLRDMGCLYIDKTAYIRELVESGSKYIFLARPRRFGKSLFLSTLRYFFEGRRELFEGLSIASTAWDWATYPVLYLDLNADRYTETGRLEEVLDNRFSVWEREYGVEYKAPGLSTRFRNIIVAAYEKTGRQVVVLVDEYDKPLVGNLGNEEHFECYRAALASIYTNFKSAAEYIRLVFLTGVSRFGKLSIFSDLNNLNDITFENRYADICGITEKELLENFQTGIARLAEERGVSYGEACELLKKNYDGYHFAPSGSDIYNPWSVLKAMYASRIADYWVYTSVPTIIAEGLKRMDADLESILNTRCPLRMLVGMDLSSINPVALMYQAGYLTIKKYSPNTEIVTLGVPNREVGRGLFEVLLPNYVRVRSKTPDMLVSEIINNLEEGEPEKLFRNIEIFLAGIPYEMKMEDENNFHNALYILLRLIGSNVDTEVHTSDGRIDLVVKTVDFIYIVELKFGKTSGEVLRQIEDKEYALPYLNDKRKLFRIGANFNKATRRLDWIVK